MQCHSELGKLKLDWTVWHRGINVTCAIAGLRCMRFFKATRILCTAPHPDAHQSSTRNMHASISTLTAARRDCLIHIFVDYKSSCACEIDPALVRTW